MNLCIVNEYCYLFRSSFDFRVVCQYDGRDLNVLLAIVEGQFQLSNFLIDSAHTNTWLDVLSLFLLLIVQLEVGANKGRDRVADKGMKSLERRTLSKLHKLQNER